jgi:hypothetical protein
MAGMPSREIGHPASIRFELELQDVDASVEPSPGLAITTRWTPTRRPQPQDTAAQLTVRYASLEVRYLPSRIGSRRAHVPPTAVELATANLMAITAGLGASQEKQDESIEVGVAQLAAEDTQSSPAWLGSDFFEQTVKFRLPLDFSVLERVERARLGADFILRLIPRGEIEQVGFSGSVSSRWQTDPTGVSLEFPRSKWSDILLAVGFPAVYEPLAFPVTTAPAKAAQVHLREAMRLVNVDQIADAVVNARRALEELRGVVPPIRPKKSDPDYREEDAATRIGRVSWAAYNLCNVKAHTRDPATFSRAEALLVIQLAAAMINYAGAPEGARGIPLAPRPAIPATTVDADYEEPAEHD